MTGSARTAWLGVTFALAGCLNPATTQLPNCMPAPNAVERRSLGHFDPLPDRDLGPDTDIRPREFLEAREPQRQAREGQLLPGTPAGPTPPGFSTGAYRDGDVVR